MGKVTDILQTPDCIVFLTSDSNYTWVYYRNGSRELFSRHLSWFEKGLPNFIRTHKSVLVNPQFVSRLQPPEFMNRSGQVVMKNGISVPISRRRWGYITERIGEEEQAEMAV